MDEYSRSTKKSDRRINTIITDSRPRLSYALSCAARPLCLILPCEHAVHNLVTALRLMSSRMKIALQQADIVCGHGG